MLTNVTPSGVASSAESDMGSEGLEWDPAELLFLFFADADGLNSPPLLAGLASSVSGLAEKSKSDGTVRGFAWRASFADEGDLLDRADFGGDSVVKSNARMLSTGLALPM